jgi:hypothetical protein
MELLGLVCDDSKIEVATGDNIKEIGLKAHEVDVPSTPVNNLVNAPQSTTIAMVTSEVATSTCDSSKKTFLEMMQAATCDEIRLSWWTIVMLGTDLTDEMYDKDESFQERTYSGMR